MLSKRKSRRKSASSTARENVLGSVVNRYGTCRSAVKLANVGGESVAYHWFVLPQFNARVFRAQGVFERGPTCKRDPL
jgi:hypothetical protein